MRDAFQNIVLGVLLAIMVGWILVVGRPVILPIVASLIVAFIINGLDDLVRGLPWIGARLPRPLRHIVSAALIVGALALLVSLLIGNIDSIVAMTPVYRDRLFTVIDAAVAGFGFDTEPLWQKVRDEVAAAATLPRALGVAVSSASAILGTLTLVTLYAVFLLLERRAFERKIDLMTADPTRAAQLRAVIADINSRVGAYLITKTLINVLLGLACYAILRLWNIEFALFWAILIGVLNYIPYVGSFVGVMLPVAGAVIQFGEIGPAVTLALALTAAQTAIGNVIDPMLMGNSLNLSPFVILLSLVFWAGIWGLPGAILSAPITAILVIVLSQFSGTRPLAVLLSRDGDVVPNRAL